MSDEIKFDFVNFGRKRNQQRQEHKIKRTPHSHMKPSTKVKCKKKKKTTQSRITALEGATTQDTATTSSSQRLRRKGQTVS